MRKGDAVNPPGIRRRHGIPPDPTRPTLVWRDWREDLFSLPTCDFLQCRFRQVPRPSFKTEWRRDFGGSKPGIHHGINCAFSPLRIASFPAVMPPPGHTCHGTCRFFSRSLASRLRSTRGCVWVFVGVSRVGRPRLGWGSRGRTGGTGKKTQSRRKRPLKISRL